MPLFLGIIGGILGYVVVKDDDRKMANKLLILGIAIMFVYALIGALAYTVYYFIR